MDREAFEGISKHFTALPDPRDLNRRHKLLDIVAIGICAVIAGAEGFEDMESFGCAKIEWLKGFLDLPHGIPSHDTFCRVFAALDPQEFEKCFESWVKAFVTKTAGEIVNIDGKSLRGSRSGDKSCLHTISAWAGANRLVLAQLRTEEKSNEIEAIPRLLDSVDVEGCTVTIDAMGCQKKIAEKIIDKRADYCLCLKGNQGDMLEEVEFYFQKEKVAFLETVDADHGRIEVRRYFASEDIDWIDSKEVWKGLRSIGMVEREREIKGNKSLERSYYLSSLPADLTLFSQAARGHWGIENSVHWVLDVCFREDASRIRRAAQNVALLRRMALNMVRRVKTKGSIKGKLKKAAWDDRFLELVLRA